MNKKLFNAPAEYRFWSRVNKNGPIPTHAPKLGKCWVFQAQPSRMYGQMMFDGKIRPAHHYLIHPIPEGKEACHKCDNPKCVRPSHIFIGTRTENIRDMWKKGRAESQRRASKKSVHHMRKFLKIEKGEGSYNHKLTEQQALQCVLCPRGKAEQLARKLGISAGQVCRIRRGVSWPQLQEAA